MLQRIAQHGANPFPIHRDWGGYGIIAPDLSND